jgi:DNA-binding NtrC family response regulator
MKSPRILIIEDEMTEGPPLARMMAGAGYKPVEVRGAVGAVDALRRSRIDLMLLDVHRPDQPELEVLRQVKRDWPNLPVIVLAAQGTIRCAVEAIRAGAADYLTRPFGGEALVGSVRRALADGPRRQPGDQGPPDGGGRAAQPTPACRGPHPGVPVLRVGILLAVPRPVVRVPSPSGPHSPAALCVLLSPRLAAAG